MRCLWIIQDLLFLGYLSAHEAIHAPVLQDLLIFRACQQRLFLSITARSLSATLSDLAYGLISTSTREVHRCTVFQIFLCACSVKLQLPNKGLKQAEGTCSCLKSSNQCSILNLVMMNGTLNTVCKICVKHTLRSLHQAVKPIRISNK